METENKASIPLNDNGNVCRVCLTTNQNNQCIFDARWNDSDNKNVTDLPEKLRLCGGVEILKDDGLPSTICLNCILKINDAHQLRKQCQQSDICLREFYGKVEKLHSINLCKNTRDQYCQTDCSFSSDLIKTETGEFSVMGHNLYPVKNSNSNIKEIKENEAINNACKPVEEEKSNSCINKQNLYVNYKQVGHETSVTGREAYRTRRMTMFKRVTSIENLKNHKERQRQYIKKNTNVKWDDDSANNETDSQTAYICPKCTRCYTSKRSLDRHVLTHNEKKFTCDKCNKHFFQLDKLAQHSKLHTVKEKAKTVLCRICDRNFRKTVTMVRHLNVHKRTNPKEVLSILKEIRDKRKLDNLVEPEEKVTEIENNNDKKETGEELATSKSITIDIPRKDTLESKDKVFEDNLSSSNVCTKKTDSSDDTLFRCRYCTKRYVNEKSLQKHLQIHVEKKFICNVCNMKFFRQDRLQSHKHRYGHDNDSALLEVQKPSDDKSAIKLINSWIREELDSDNEEKGFPCKTCGKSYDTKKSLLKHQLSMHNPEEEDCATCGKSCTCDEKDKDQQKSNERLKPYRCDECNKSFEKEIKLQKHVRIHERAKEEQDVNFKRFLCHICSKTFRQNTGLMFHMRTHTGYKPYVCKYCGRGFTSNSNCINHERTHTGDRPFVCHFCSAAFAKSCTLKAHITTHTGEANYHCKTCGKSFRRLKYLKEHKFTHTGEKPYACKICGTAYSHSGSLFVHEKKCKAQYNSYQSNTVQNTQTYCESETSSPSVTPIITVLPPVHLNNSNAMNTQSNKSYIDNIQRINSQNINNLNTVNASDLHIHPNSDISDVSLAVKSFALIGQMFQS